MARFQDPRELFTRAYRVSFRHCEANEKYIRILKDYRKRGYTATEIMKDLIDKSRIGD